MFSLLFNIFLFSSLFPPSYTGTEPPFEKIHTPELPASQLNFLNEAIYWFPKRRQKRVDTDATRKCPKVIPLNFLRYFFIFFPLNHFCHFFFSKKQIINQICIQISGGYHGGRLHLLRDMHGHRLLPHRNSLLLGNEAKAMLQLRCIILIYKPSLSQDYFPRYLIGLITSMLIQTGYRWIDKKNDNKKSVLNRSFISAVPCTGPVRPKIKNHIDETH